MAIKHIVTLGFGFADGVTFIPTLGYSVSGAIGGPYTVAQTATFVAGPSVGDTWTDGPSTGQLFNAGPAAGMGEPT